MPHGEQNLNCLEIEMSDKQKFLATFGNSDHIDHALNHSHDQDIIEAAAKNPSLSDDQMNKLVNSPTSFHRVAVAINPSLKKEHTDKLINDDDEDVRISLSQNPSLKKEHIDKLLQDNSHWVIPNLVGGHYKHDISHEQATTGIKTLKRIGSRFVDAYKKDVKRKYGHDL